jgi:hypothetical protein
LANATVYCVNDSDPSCQVTETPNAAGLATAFAAAAGTPSANSIRIGPGTYDAPSPDGFHYDNGTFPLHVVGAGVGSTTIAVQPPAGVPGVFTNFLGLNVRGDGSSITGLTVTLPTPFGSTSANQRYLGIEASRPNDTISQVAVTAPSGVAMFATGIQLDSGTVSDATVTLPVGFPETNVGLRVLNTTSSNLFAQRVSINADDGFENDNTGTGMATVTRSTINAALRGVLAQAATVNLSDTVVDLGASTNAQGLVAGYGNPGLATVSTLMVDGVTVYGTGTNQRGGYAFATDAAGDHATLTLQSSVIDVTDPSSAALERFVNNGAQVNLNTGYSNYDPGKVLDTVGAGGGTGALTQGNQTNFPPDFVSAVSGNFRLQGSSQLIDAGNPVAPSPAETDREGNARAIAVRGCPARRDIGAYEYALNPLDCTPLPSAPGASPLDTAPPETAIGSHPKAKTKNRRATFSFGSSEAGSSFLCSYDGKPSVSCTPPFTTPKLKTGKHRFDVSATDSVGNRDQTAATFFWKVVNRKR